MRERRGAIFLFRKPFPFSQTIPWFATASCDGIPLGWGICATRTTRGCRGSTRCARCPARTESIPFRIYRWREWVAWGRTLGEPRRSPPATFTPTRCCDYWSSPLLCSNCDVRSCDALGHLSFPKREPALVSRENLPYRRILRLSKTCVPSNFIALVSIVEQSCHGRGDATRLNDRYPDFKLCISCW